MKVDLIVTNARVYTVNVSFAISESFAIQDGKFLAIGSNEEISSKYNSDQVIDCGGMPVYPGFNDAHCHFYAYGMELMQYADLTGLGNKEEIYTRLQEHHNRAGGRWVLGRGWDQNLWPEKDFPDNKRLNELFGDWAARAGFEEKNKGSIEPGKSADFVLLDTDLMNCREDEILSAKVLRTVLDGQMVYQLSR